MVVKEVKERLADSIATQSRYVHNITKLHPRNADQRITIPQKISDLTGTNIKSYSQLLTKGKDIYLDYVSGLFY